jgi:hypothetical protein
MAAIVLEFTVLVAVVLSFALAALVIAFSHRPSDAAVAKESAADAPRDDPESAAETMSRVLAEIERLAALRDRGVLTHREFAAQKTKLLQGGR